MTFDWNVRGVGAKAWGARVAGLGVAATLAVTVCAAPVTALAEEAAEPVAEAVTVEVVEDSAPVEEAASAAPDGAAVVASADAPSTAQETTAGTAAQNEGEAGAAAETTVEVDSARTASDAKPVSTEAGAASGAAQTSPAPADAPSADAPSAETEAKDPAAESATETQASSVQEKSSSAQEGTPSAKANTVVDTTAPQSAPAVVSADVQATSAETIVDKMNVYRLYSPKSGEHLYTKDLYEATTIASKFGWQWEGVGFTASSSKGQEVWRLWDSATGLHLWTTDAWERHVLLTERTGWRDEGLAWYGAGPYRMSRLYDPKSSQHLYTRDANEVKVLTTERGWKLETDAGTWSTGSATDYVPIKAQWLVTDSWGEEGGRYWIQSNGNIATNRFIEASEGTGYRAYATSTGAVVRGKQVVGTVLALADKDGRLLADKTLGNKEGWWVTQKVDGAWQRYWLTTDPSTGVMGARLGKFTYDGKEFFGREDEGYVVRGVYFSYPLKQVFHADNGGVLYDSNTQTDQYVRWAIAMAEDNSHGYSQIWRWGERGDYDCSSFVVTALQHAGYSTGSATWTGNMYEELGARGWRSLGVDPNNLQYGDILLNDAYHTAIYICNGYLVQASSDENNSWEGYRAGDQTGKEIYVKKYYNYPWDRVLRHV